MSKKEFEEFVDKTFESGEPLIEMIGKVVSPKLWQWIEQQIKQARVDELEKLVIDITDDLDNATIFKDATRAYGLMYARTTAQNRIKELNET